MERVSTAEKRKELEERGVPWPSCECCNLPMKWRSYGVFVKRCEDRNRQKLGALTEKGRERRRRADRIYKSRRIFIYIGGLQFIYLVDPKEKENIKLKISEFRNYQREEYKEYNGGID